MFLLGASVFAEYAVHALKKIDSNLDSLSDDVLYLLRNADMLLFRRLIRAIEHLLEVLNDVGGFLRSDKARASLIDLGLGVFYAFHTCCELGFYLSLPPDVSLTLRF